MRKYLLYALAGLVALFLVVFALVDHRVARRLEARLGTQVPAILSAPFRIEVGQLIRPTILRQELLGRRYSETKVEPASPGEFRIVDQFLEVHSREYLSPHGGKIPAKRAKYDFLSGEINSLDDPSISVPELTFNPNVIAHLGGGNLKVRQHKALKQIPKQLRQAVLSVEDQRFYSHIGLDFFGIARATISNLRAGRIVQGGSTVTQQLAKNLLFTPQKTFLRKAMEAFASLSLELRLTKSEILELYLNEVYFGQEGSIAIHGVESASYTFFGKSVERLSLPESALLAGLIRAPSYYSPRRYPERAKKRRDLVLRKMYEVGYVTQAEFDQAKNRDVDVITKKQHRQIAPYFISSVRRELAKSVDIGAALLSRAKVHTGLSPSMQECATKAVTSELAALEKRLPALAKHQPRLEAGLVAIDPRSGLIRAWVGGRNFGRNQFDHVSQLKRQIGSTVKPFLYLAALDKNLNSYKVATPRSILEDRPLTISLPSGKRWTPDNYDKKFRGSVTLRYALEKSLNVPAVYVGERIGVSSLSETLQRFRVSESPPAVPALALGAADTSLIDLTAGYAALANGGVYVAPRLFISARAATGEMLATSEIIQEHVADPNAVYVLTDMLRGVLHRGTGAVVSRRGYKRPAAGKTGTSSDTRDAWFVGYTPSLTAGVWVGFDNSDKIGLTGGGAAAPIWAEFMKCAEPYYPEAQFSKPHGVVSMKIDPSSGKRWSADCATRQYVQEVFVAGTEPTGVCGLGDRPGRDLRPYRPGREKPKPKRRERSFWDKLFG